MKNPRIPKRIKLPKWEIRVNQVTPAELARVAVDADSTFQVFDDYGEILINKSLSYDRRLYLFAHEMQHAVADYLHQIRGRS